MPQNIMFPNQYFFGSLNFNYCIPSKCSQFAGSRNWLIQCFSLLINAFVKIGFKLHSSAP